MTTIYDKNTVQINVRTLRIEKYIKSSHDSTKKQHNRTLVIVKVGPFVTSISQLYIMSSFPNI